MPGGRILEAKPGGTHGDLMDEDEVHDAMEYGSDALGDFGFTYPGSGKYLTREEALKQLRSEKAKDLLSKKR